MVPLSWLVKALGAGAASSTAAWTLRTIAGASSSVDPTSLAQYGIAGVIGYFLIQFMRGVIDKERERADRLELALIEANKSSQQDALGALANNTAAMTEAISFAKEIKAERDEAQRELARELARRKRRTAST